MGRPCPNSGPEEGTQERPAPCGSKKPRRRNPGPAPWVLKTLRLVDTAPDAAAATWTKWRSFCKAEGAWSFSEPWAWARTWAPPDWRESAQDLLDRWVKGARSLAVDPRAGLWLGACSAAVCGIIAWRQNTLLHELRTQHIELMRLTRQVDCLKQ